MKATKQTSFLFTDNITAIFLYYEVSRHQRWSSNLWCKGFIKEVTSNMRWKTCHLVRMVSIKWWTTISTTR